MKGVIESFEFLEGLPLVRWRVVMKHEDLGAFGFPCYLKSDVVGHKTDLGAVMRCDNLKDAEENLKKMHKTFPKNNIVVQETFDGVEMIVGVKEDLVFGKLLLVGFGGIFAEVEGDVSFRSLPVSRREAIEMVHDLEVFKAFGARNKKYDLEDFYTLLEKVAYLADKKDIKELDLNPVIVGEKESKIVDARIETD